MNKIIKVNSCGGCPYIQQSRKTQSDMIEDANKIYGMKNI